MLANIVRDASSQTYADLWQDGPDYLAIPAIPLVCHTSYATDLYLLIPAPCFLPIS